MFDAGFLEMLVIGVITLLVVGPERLPKVASTVGGWIGKARAFVSTTKSSIEHEFQAEQMREMLDKQSREIDELKDIVRHNANVAQEQVADVTDNIENSIKSSTNQKMND